MRLAKKLTFLFLLGLCAVFVFYSLVHQKTITIPVVNKNQVLYLPIATITIDNVEINLLFDTGSPISFVMDSVHDSIKSTKSHVSVTAEFPLFGDDYIIVDEPLYLVNSNFKINNIPMGNLRYVPIRNSVNLKILEYMTDEIGVPIHGILGYSDISFYNLTIDYQNKTIQIFKSFLTYIRHLVRSNFFTHEVDSGLIADFEINNYPISLVLDTGYVSGFLALSEHDNRNIFRNSTNSVIIKKSNSDFVEEFFVPEGLRLIIDDELGYIGAHFLKHVVIKVKDGDVIIDRHQ